MSEEEREEEQQSGVEYQGSTARVKLSYPVELSRTVYSEIVIKAPKGSDFFLMPIISDAEKVTYGHFAKMLESCSDAPSAVIERLEFEDMQKVIAVCMNFLAGGHRTPAPG